MAKRTISAVIGKGDIFHNNRKIITENVDKDKSHENNTIVKEDIKVVYHELFDIALAEYNARQNRNDRKIKDYHVHIRHSRQEKEFHEVIFQIGNRNDTHCGSDEAQITADILKRYAEDFQKRNPHLRVFNAVVHMDEETPHLHIDFVPFATEQTRGLSTRVSLTKALEQQGFIGEGKLNTSSKLWIDSEKEILAKMMLEKGLEWEQLGTHENHLSVINYKKKEREKEVGLLNIEIDKKIIEKDNILNYEPNIDEKAKIERRFDRYIERLDELTRNPLTIGFNKSKIYSVINDIRKTIAKNMKDRDKSDNMVYETQKENHKFSSDCKWLREKNQEIRDKNEDYFTLNKALKEEVNQLRDIINVLERINKPLFDSAREYVKRMALEQLEQAQKQKIKTLKRKNFELE